ncbi:DUF1749 domain-containing protein [Candidatus Parcubacteria bacterium]|jgi:predicted alpha/beta hydrolase family esterase|nr:MAG: DUF1749 domain-containing protein [Candidatus Parcubacteria bacterium]
MLKKVFIIHGWGGFPEEGWFPWAKSGLLAKGFAVKVFEMPNTENPVIEEWVEFLQKNIVPDDQTYLIGHSIGCQAILRYLESLPLNVKIGGSVLVAGWFDLDNLETEAEKAIAKPWINTPIDFEKVKAHCEKFTAILSDNDPFGFLESNKEIFEEKLGAEIRVLKNKGHLNEMRELPEVIQAL